jgi:hypothetical protein
MHPFMVMLCIVVIIVALYLIGKWYCEMVVTARHTELEEQLMLENTKLKRELSETRAENLQMKYERTHTKIEIKEI